MDFLLRILLSLISLAVSVYFGTLEFLRRLKVQILSAKHSSPSEELTESKRMFHEFEKTPRHFGVILNEKSVHYPDIANIIVWCLALGIQNVSIYDVSGTMQLNMFTLYKEALTAKKKILKDNEQKRKILMYCSSRKEDFENGIQNGYKGHQADIEVCCLSWENGKDSVANAAHTVCEEKTKEINTKEEDDQKMNLSERLKCLPGFPDPDVIVCFGGGQSLGGYLPWHIRLTEFTFYQTHRNFRLNEFMEVFKVYSKCEQRVGK